MTTSTHSLTPPTDRKWTLATMAGAVVAAFLASACCIGPVVLALLGLGGAGLLVKLEPYRPYFTVVTAAALGAGFWLTYRKPRGVEGADCGCEHPRTNRLGKVMLSCGSAFGSLNRPAVDTVDAGPINGSPAEFLTASWLAVPGIANMATSAAARMYLIFMTSPQFPGAHYLCSSLVNLGLGHRTRTCTEPTVQKRFTRRDVPYR